MFRLFGISLGIFTHALFAFAVWNIFWFLRGNVPLHDVAPPAWWIVDVGLALQFAVLHSVLLYPAVRERLGRYIPAPFYGCFFCVVTCVCFLIAIFCWQT